MKFKLESGHFGWYVVHAVATALNGALMPQAAWPPGYAVLASISAACAMWCVAQGHTFQEEASLLTLIMILLASLIPWPVDAATLTMVVGIYAWEGYEKYTGASIEAAGDMMNDIWIGLMSFALAFSASANLRVRDMFAMPYALIFLSAGVAAGMLHRRVIRLGCKVDWLLPMHATTALVVLALSGTEWLQHACNLACFAFGSAITLWSPFD